MPRNHNPGASTLRNRNRVTNKTRLKIIHGTIDADPLVLDEDEEKARIISTAGVDAEDANEHHLQAVLSAASQRNQAGSQRSTRGAAEKKSDPAPTAYIPTPDSTGIVDNYEELYKPGRWEDPATYIRSSETVEEYCDNALADQFTYYMDERDKEWLDKNNEEARGEGTSASGALSTSGTTTRSGMSSRSAKARGKEPEVAQPVAISEDEFELVMGLFERVTHEKTEYLHHGLEQGMAFPPFSDYQDTFSQPLPAAAFASFIVPSWIPQPPHLTRIARSIYPYWRERRIERGGHQIIPRLNFDESDTLNESYICFRRRETKSVRKTRASQVTSSDKLLRLDNELFAALELVKIVIQREAQKQEVAQHSQMVWEKRVAVADLKRRFPSLGVKEDDELLHDKERVLKRPKNDGHSRLGLRLRTRDSDMASPSAQEIIRPKDRTLMIKSQIERELARQKDRDYPWDDQIDNVYQPLPVPFSQRLFKYIPSSDAPSWPSSSLGTTDEEPPSRAARALRLRFGRGGRLMVDRRQVMARSSWTRSEPLLPRRRRQSPEEDGDAAKEGEWRLQDRWKFDADDYPPVGPEGPDEQDRVLVDDYDPKFLRQTMTLLHEQDMMALMTDATIIVQAPDGRPQQILPFRLGPQQPIMRRDPQRVYPPGTVPSISSAAQLASVAMSLPLSSNNGTPISIQAQMKKMQPPSGLPQMRISSNGGMRPPTQPVASMQPPPQQQHSSPPHHSATPTVNGINGTSRNGNVSDNDAVIPSPNPSISTGTPNQQDNNLIPIDGNTPRQLQSPAPPKALIQQQQQQHVVVPNGYHITAMNGYPPIPNGSQFPHHMNGPHNGLSIQQMQNLKTAFANTLPPGQDLNSLHANGRLPPSFMAHTPNGANFNMQLGGGVNMNMKLPAARPMQWNGSPQRPTSVLNGGDSGLINSSMSPSPSLAHSVPVRSPSANGIHVAMRGANVGHVLQGGHSMSPHMQHSPSPLPSTMIQSPPRPSQTPAIVMASPSSQHLQPVIGSQGY